MALDLKSKGPAYNYSKSVHNQGAMSRRFKKAFLTFFVLAVLLVGGAAAYTWYMGRYNPVADNAPVVQTKRTTPPPTSQVDENAKVGISSQAFTDKVVPGKNASLTIKTNAQAACSIRVEYDKQASTDSGLNPKKADEYGVASWAWTVETSRPVGKWPVVVTCANAKNSAVLALDLIVAAE